MRYQFIKGSYQSDGTIKLFARGEDGKKYEKSIIGFRPYFYVPAGSFIPPHVNHLSTEVGYTFIYGESLVKLVMNDPTDVGKRNSQGEEVGFRSKFTNHFEADIPFIRRFLIDTGVKSGFEAPNQDTISYLDIKPCDFQTAPIICFLDIEVFTKWRFPDPKHANEKVIAISVRSSKSKIYYTYLLGDKLRRETLSPNHILLIFDTEAKLFIALKQFLTTEDPDVISGWNVFWDLDYLRSRAKKFGIDDLGFERCLQFDLLRACRRVLGKGSYSLKDFVIDDGIATEVVAEEFHYEMYEEDIRKFIEYSKNDVMYCVQIDSEPVEKDGKRHGGYNLIRYFWDFKNYVGLEDMNQALFHGVKVDTVLLRMAHDRFVLPSKGDYDEDESFIGAMVIEPKIGIHTGVAEFDMSKYYPMIVLAHGLSPEKKNGIACELVNYMLQERKRYDKMLEEFVKGSKEWEDFRRKWQVVKDLLNSVWGYFGYQGGRLYVKSMAEKITTFAREGLEFMVGIIGDKLEIIPKGDGKVNIRVIGNHVLYGDTDGLKVKIDFEDAEALATRLNEALRKWCISQNIDPLLVVKFEKYYSRVAFVRSKQANDEGAKKRYVAHVCWEGGQDVDYVWIRGFEAIKRDSSKLTRVMQRRVLEMLARGGEDKLSSYIQSVIQDMRDRKYSLNDMAINKTLNKGINDYDIVPNFVRGSLYANRHLGLDIKGGDQVKMLFVKSMPNNLPRIDVVCFLDEQQLPEGIVIDIDTTIEKTVKDKIETIIELVGLQWNNISGEYAARLESF